MSVLDELAEQIRKGCGKKHKKKEAQKSISMSKPQPLVKSGPGGVLFNFGNVTGNPMVDAYNLHLQHHADPEQLKIAKGQQTDFTRALDEFVTKGEHQYSIDRAGAEEFSGVHKSWDKQFSQSTDQQVVEAFNKGVLDVNENQQNPHGGGNLPRGEFSKSQIKMGDENIVATSETDAALIEMMKGGALEEDS